MIDRLKKAISKKLKQAFPDFTVYRSNPAQNIQEPCFIIECVNVANSDLFYVEYQKEVTEVDYMFSVTLLLPRNNQLLNEVISRVLFCLKWLYLEDGKPVLTLNRQAHPIDDSSVSITFNIQREVVQAGKKPPLMKEMIENIGLNDEKKN